MLILLAAGISRGADSAGAVSPEADTLSVEQCIALARSRAPDVLSTAALLAAARSDSVAAGFNRRPAFSVNGGVLVAPRGFYDPVITNLGEYQLKLAAEWPLLDGGSRRRERARAALAAAASAVQLASSARENAIRAATVAVDQLRQQELEGIETDAQGWLDRLAAVIESSVRAGAHGRADALRVGLERSAVTAALVETRRLRGILDRELPELLGRTASRQLIVVPPEPGVEEPPTPADSLGVLARAAESPSVRSAETDEALERVAVGETQRRNAVAAGLVADAGLAGADLTSAVPQDFRDAHRDATFTDRLRRDLGASISIQLKRPLADPSLASSRRAREETLRAATLRRLAATARARRDAMDLIGDWRAAGARRDIARDAEERAQENLLRARSLYAGGGAGLLELLDARRQLDDARERLADARFEVRLAHYQAEIR